MICLAAKTENAFNINPNHPFGNLKDTFNDIRVRQEQQDNCLAVNDLTELITSYNCADTLNYVCQKSNTFNIF